MCRGEEEEKGKGDIHFLQYTFIKHWSRYYEYEVESDIVAGLKELIVYIGVQICKQINSIEYHRCYYREL